MISKLFDKITGVSAAAWICWIAGLLAIAQAFLGAERARSMMQQTPVMIITALLSAILFYAAWRSAHRKRWSSLLIHLGTALICSGWLWGEYTTLHTSSKKPVSGYMVLTNGQNSDTLWVGKTFSEFAGQLPFKLLLNEFKVEYYNKNMYNQKRSQPPAIREYCSRVTISIPHKKTFDADIKVNHPLYVCGYHIYQMSWGQSLDHANRPILYTVLLVSRDPGLPLVYAGFATLFAGVLYFAGSLLKKHQPSVAEIMP